MKKQLWTIALTGVAVLCVAAGLAACGKAKVTEHTHRFAEEWSHDEENHWHAATCEHTLERSGEAAHDYADGVCTVCHYAHTEHNFSYSEKAETGHTATCSVCHKVETQPHDYDTGVCADCGYEHAEHTFTYSLMTEKRHTATCSVCHKVEISSHNYENGTCTVCHYAHTEHKFSFSEKTETGHTATCSVCHKVETVPHNYQNGVCADCEYAHVHHTYGADHTCEVCGAQQAPYTQSEDGTKIYFGEYPQTEISDKNDTDSSLRNSLNMAAGSRPTGTNAGKWTDYNYYAEGSVRSYMWYIDVNYGDHRYRGVFFTEYRPKYTTRDSSDSNSRQDDNGYETGTAYWFRYEPIEWRVLEEKDNTALLLANFVLDNQQWYHEESGTRTIDGKTVYPNNYKESDIRAWLNGTFYSAAFDEAAKALVETTEVDNSAATTKDDRFDSFICENTTDHIFLLSYQDIYRAEYGFAKTVFSDARMLKTTDYANVQGASSFVPSMGISPPKDEAFGTWYLRSPDYSKNSRVHIVNYDGTESSGGEVHYLTGIVPTLRIRLA